MKNILQKIIYTFLLLISVVGNPAFSSTTFTANGSYTVPAGVTKIKIAVKGGGGGGGGIDGPAQGGVGASGQWVSATYSVVPGTIYTILVGKGGEAGGTDTCTGNASLGGASDYAAGGAGGLTGCLGTSGKGGGGGGATAVLEAGTAIVVAGGGGGANGAATPASTGLSGTCSTTLELTAASTGSVGANGVSFATGPSDDGSGGGGGGGGVTGGTGGTGVVDHSAALSGIAATGGTGFMNATNLLASAGPVCSGGVGGAGGAVATSGGTGSVVIDEVTYTISGKVFLDANGNASSSGTGLPNATVRLMDASGNVYDTVLTDSLGNYSLSSNLADALQYVVVDPPTTVLGVSQILEQTYASAGTNNGVGGGPVCAGAYPNYTLQSNTISAWTTGAQNGSGSGPCYGGRRAVGANVSGVVGLSSKEFITIITSGSSAYTDVNFGFAHHVVTNTSMVADSQAEGTLQVVNINLNNSGSSGLSSTMRFVPAHAPSVGGSASTNTSYWLFQLLQNSSFTPVGPGLKFSKSGIVFDGRPISNADGSSYLAQDDMDAAVLAGTDGISLPAFKQPRAHLAGGGVLGNIVEINATNVTFRDFSLTGTFSTGIYTQTSPSPNGLNIFNNLLGVLPSVRDFNQASASGSERLGRGIAIETISGAVSGASGTTPTSTAANISNNMLVRIAGDEPIVLGFNSGQTTNGVVVKGNRIYNPETNAGGTQAAIVVGKSGTATANLITQNYINNSGSNGTVNRGVSIITSTSTGNIILNNTILSAGNGIADSSAGIFLSAGANTISKNIVNSTKASSVADNGNGVTNNSSTANTIFANSLNNNNGAGVLVGASALAVISQNIFANNSRNSIDHIESNSSSVTSNATALNGANCPSNGSTANGGLPRPEISSAIMVSANLKITGLICGSGTHTLEVYKSVSGNGDFGALDGAAASTCTTPNAGSATCVAAGEANVYVGSITGVSGGTIFDRAVTLASGVSVSAGDVLTISDTCTAGCSTAMSGTSEFSAVKTTTSSVVSIAGNVFIDPTSIAGSGSASASQRVRLFAKSGLPITSTLTDASGNYSFNNLSADTYYVAVDAMNQEQVWGSSGNADTGSGPICVGAAPTYTQRVNYTTSPSEWVVGSPGASPSNGVCFGGRRGAVGDTLSTVSGGFILNDKEHVTKVIAVSQTAVTGVNFGFSFDVVTHVSDVATCPQAAVANTLVVASCQGSIRQFLTNANTITGADSMRFVPTVVQNAGTWWQLTAATSLPTSTGSDTTFDGTAYNNTNGTVVLNSNDVLLGDTTTSVGRITGPLPGLNAPELELKYGGFSITSTNFTMQNVAVYGGQFNLGPSINTVFDRVLFGSTPGGFVDPGLANRGNYHVFATGTISGMTVKNSLAGYSRLGGFFLNNNSHSDIKFLDNEFRSNGMNSAVDESISMAGVSALTGDSKVDHVLFINNNSSGIQFYTFGGTFSVLNSSFINNGLNSNAGGINSHKNNNNLITIKNNVFLNNTGPGIYVNGLKGTLITQNSFSGNSSNAIDLSSNGVSLNTNACTNTSGSGSSNGGLARPVINLSSVSSGTLSVSGTMCATGSFDIEIYKASSGTGDTSATDGLAAGEGSVYLGTLSNQSGGVFSGSFAVSASDFTSTDQLTALAIRTTAGLGVIGDTSEFSANLALGTISGFVFQDTHANLLASETIGDSNNPVLSGQTVRLFNSLGTQIASTTTNATGEYSFSNLVPGNTFYVAVDAPIVATSAILEQTYASVGQGNDGTLGGSGAGTFCISSNYISHTSAPNLDTSAVNASNGACFGGRQASVADSGTSTLSTKEHVTRVVMGTSTVVLTDVSFGFSPNVVTNVLDTAQQGSLRQFVTNANAITGANSMRFVPSIGQNAGSSSYWSINSSSSSSANVLALIDSSTTIDGTAYNNDNGTVVIDSNSGTLGYSGVVGVGPDGLAASGDEATMSPVNKPELELISTTAPTVPGFLIKGPNQTIQNIAIVGFGNSSTGSAQISAASGVLSTNVNINNLNVNNTILGAKANSFANPSFNQGAGIEIKDVGTGISINNNLIGFSSTNAGVVVWGSNSTSGTIRNNYVYQNKYGVQVSNANATITIQKNLIDASTAHNITLTTTTASGVSMTENTLSNALGNSVLIVGDNNTIASNLIFGTTGNAIAITSGRGNTISKNSTYSNSGLGIDLANNGVTVNDASDSDSGANNLQNFPMISSGSVLSGNLNVRGCAPANSTIELFTADQTSLTCPAGNQNALGDGSVLCYGEGKSYLGSTTVGSSATCTLAQSSDGNSVTGLVDFSMSVPAGAVTNNGNSFITATATLSNSTSEFSPNRQVVAPITIQVNKSIVSRINAADQFTTQIKTGITANSVTTTGVVVSNTTWGGGVTSTGTGLSFTATPYEASSTTTYTLTQVMASASVSSANFYRSTIECNNSNSGSATVLPSGKVLFDPNVGVHITPNAGDVITCTIEDTSQPRVTLNKSVVARSTSTDEFTIALTGAGLISGTNSINTVSGANSATTGEMILTSGNTYQLTDTTTTGSSSMDNYASSISCTNSSSSSTTVLPTNSSLLKAGTPPIVSTSLIPVAGDVITCTYTNNLNLPKLTINKLTRNGVGSFSYTGNNGFVNSTVTTTQDLSQSSSPVTASNSSQMLAATSVTTVITESMPTSWTLESATCYDNNAAVSGNPTGSVIGVLSSSTSLSINAAFVKNGADLICTFTNRLNLPAISGKVFLDSGVGTGGVANDGVQNGSEIGIGGVQLQLTNCAGSAIVGSSPILTAGDGTYNLIVPSSVSAGTTICVEETNLAQYTSTTVAPTYQSSYARDLDKVTVSWNGSAISGLNFGDVKSSVLTGDNNKLISPGSSTSLAHSFKASTAGVVTFTLINQSSSPALSNWSEKIYLDNNCDAKVDTTNGDTALITPLPVVADQTICLVVQVTAPLGAPENAQLTFNLLASLVYDNLTSVVEEMSNKDTILTASSVLMLVKEVKNVTAGGNFVIQNSAKAGEILEYKITFTNNSLQGINNLVINDATPAYTSFLSAACPSSLPSGITACTTPSSTNSNAPSVGGVGAIKWLFTGTLPASAFGTVSYKVKVDE